MKIRAITSGLVFILYCGCATQYRDISDNQQYSPLIGAIYRSTNVLYISGVNAPPGYGDTIDYYTIDPLNHKWSGPEKITEDELPKGTRLTVLRIRKPVTYYLGDIIQCEVSISPYKTENMHPIYIGLNDLIASGVNLNENCNSNKRQSSLPVTRSEP